MDLHDQYEKRIEAILTRMADAFRKAGFQVGEVRDMSTDMWHWDIPVWFPESNTSDLIDGDFGIIFEIMESEFFDGEEDGINFCLQAMLSGGNVLGEVCPSNFTEECWVDRNDPKAVEDRFVIMEATSDAEVLEFVQRELADRNLPTATFMV